MSDTINAETLPTIPPGSEGVLIGLDSSNQGALYDAKAMAAGRLRSSSGASSALNITGSTTEGSIIEVDSASTVVITIDADGTPAFPVLGQVQLYRTGAGKVKVEAAGGVTLLTAGRPYLRAVGSHGVLRKLAANKWLWTGDTSAT